MHFLDQVLDTSKRVGVALFQPLGAIEAVVRDNAPTAEGAVAKVELLELFTQAENKIGSDF